MVGVWDQRGGDGVLRWWDWMWVEIGIGVVRDEG